MYKTLIYEVTDGIATITLNRPEAGNAFSIDAFRETTEAFEECDRDERVKVVIVTGSGKNFSAGGDVKAMQTKGYISYENAIITSAMSGAVKKCSKPVVAMINGTAAGAGFGLALACDFRIMSEKSSLVSAFIGVGLTGDTGSLYHLYHIVGLSKTLELMMLGTPIKGESAYALGLATKLVPEDQLQIATKELAEKLKEKAPLTVALQKKLIYSHFYKDYDEYRELEARVFDDSGNTKDHLEAVMAFLSKRKPIFKGL